jgi:hypothetical protein
MFAKEFTHKNGLYTAMHNVAHIYTKKVRSHKENALCKIGDILFKISSSVQVQLSRLPYYMRRCSHDRLL